MAERETADSPLRLTVLGSGDAFNGCGCNAAFLVDDRVLVDCGAPVQVMLPRAGAAVAAIDLVLLTHFHADHTFMLPVFLGARAFSGDPRPGITIAGPVGTREYVRRVLMTGYGQGLVSIIEERVQPRWAVLQDGTDISLAGYRVRAHAVVHSSGPSLAYMLNRAGTATLGFSGDSTLCAGLRRAISSSDVMVCECSGWDAPVEGGHLWRGEVEKLIREYPRTRFVISHLGRLGSLPGALTAHDLLSLEISAGSDPR
jgi:ribonuclease Z